MKGEEKRPLQEGDKRRTSPVIAPRDPCSLPCCICGPFFPSGILYVNRSLDFETSPKYFLSIECIRKASASLSDVTTIVVNVTDVNEHHPRFPKDLYSARVLENAIRGDIILTVRILDCTLCGAGFGWALTSLPLFPVICGHRFTYQINML